MPQEPLLTTEQLAEVLKVPETLVLSFLDQGLLPTAKDTKTTDSSEPKFFRSEVVRALRQYPEAMDAIRQAMRETRK
jgi:hypothetical protein